MASGFPTGYSGGGDDSVTLHEFGHVIRHGYDGDAGHFLGDVVTHNYLQNHESCNKTGLGFAFNEGWAEYWARDYAPAPSCAGRAADDYEVEGNVAAALADIEVRCYGGRRAPMVDVLRANPGVIHSFAEFQARATCPAPVVASPPPVRAAPLAVIVLSAAERAAIARAQVTALDDQLRRLRVELRTAERRRAAVRLPRCARTPCNAALRRVTLPATLRTEIALARLIRRTIDDQDTVNEQQALANLTVAAATKRMTATERANRIAAAKASADGIRDALIAGRPVFANDSSKATRRLRALLVRRLASFRAAQKGAAGTPGLVLDQAIVDRILKVTPKEFPNPEPTPDVRENSILTLACTPGPTKAGSYAISGTVTPAHAGVGIELHITPPGGVEVVQTTTTDANGGYAGAIPMTQVGTWTTFARWTGDADTKPDDSPGCQTVIT